MPRNITVNFADGTQHVYQNAPDDITPDAVSARVAKEFPTMKVTGLDGGRDAAPAAAPAAPAAPAAAPSDPTEFGKQLHTMLTDKSVARADIEKFAGDRTTGLKASLDYRDKYPTYPGEVVNLPPAAAPAAAPAPAPMTDEEKAKAAGTDLGNEASSDGQGFTAGLARGMFGVPEIVAAGLERVLPSSLTGNTTDASFSNILEMIRAKDDALMSAHPKSGFAGEIGGGLVGGGVAARGVKALAGRMIAGGGAVDTAVGNTLQRLTTLNKGAKYSNAGKLLVAGTAAGATQGTLDGTGTGKGAAAGAVGTVVLGGGFKAAQVLTRPIRDFLHLSSAGQILSRLTKSTMDEIRQRADEYRAATGAEPTVFELLPLADRNKILKSAVTGRDNVVEQASGAIRERSANLGPEMEARARQILDPRRAQIEANMGTDLAAAREGAAPPGGAPPAPTPEEAALAADAARSPTDMLALRDQEARSIMEPHNDTPAVQNLHELYPSVPGTDAQGNAINAETDPEVSAAIRSVAGTIRNRAADAGISAGDISNMITKLRGDLGNGGAEGRTAQRAIDHLEHQLELSAPDAAVAHAQMTATYAARSRMAEGMQEGVRTRLRDSVPVGTNRTEARRVRNAYDSGEGADGRVLGQGNKILTDLGGSPEEALKATVGMSRNSVGRQLEQNVGRPEAQALVAASRAQDNSAQALAAAAQTASGTGGETANAETLVQALVGLHPASFITTKAGAIRKIMDMTYIPENRARTMVDMLFSQDPTVTRRAIDALGNSPNGAKATQYISGLAGSLSAANADYQGAAPTTPPPLIPLDPAPGEQAPGAPEEGEPAPDGDNGAAAADGQVADPHDGSSPYSPQLQHVYDTETPALLDLIGRVSGQESKGHQFDAKTGLPTTSKAGAIGVMQVMPDTAPEAAKLAGVPWDENAYRNDATYNKVIGIAYLSQLLRKYDGSVVKALAAYNAGQGKVDKALKGSPQAWLQSLPPETQDYVQKLA